MRKYIQKLQDLKDSLASSKFEIWFHDYERVNDEIQQSFYEVMFKSDCNTKDEESKNILEEFYTEIMPILDVLNHDIQMQLPVEKVQDLSGCLAEAIRIQKRSFNKVNSEVLFPRESMLTQRYSDITGSLFIEWKGESLSMPAAWDLIQASDQDTREKVFNLIVQAREEVREEINTIFIELVSIRRQVALNAGFPNYSEYYFFTEGREWTAEQCKDLHAQISKYLLPVQDYVHQSWIDKKMVPNLKPWNIQPLENSKKVFNGLLEFEELLNKILQDMPYTIRHASNKKIQKDLMNRLDKKVGGYCGWMPITRDNILLMNATGTDDDVFTYFHELGHATHHWLSGKYQGSFDHEAQTEFAEVASMSLELLSLKYMKKAGLDIDRITREKFEADVTFMPYMSVVDLFQHWLYTTTEDITSEVLDAKWAELFQPRVGLADYSGYESFMASGWQRKAHIFENPFYYVEYGISQLGAWQIFSNSRVDEEKAWCDYFEALSLGGSSEIDDLYSVAGIKFPLSYPVVQRYANEIIKELKGYNK